MGGFDTMITDVTRNVADRGGRGLIRWRRRKMARRHGLHTDASHRFERGADYGATARHVLVSRNRILESTGGDFKAKPST